MLNGGSGSIATATLSSGSDWGSLSTGLAEAGGIGLLGDLSPEAYFGRLAREQPADLLRQLSDGSLSDDRLTFAAEAVGAVAPEHYPFAVLALLNLLAHPRPYVREGAVYGISKLAGRVPSMLECLRALATDDEPSPGVREAAIEALADLER